MDIATLTEIGLNKTQARAYIQLIKKGSMTPPELSKLISESRTNSYAVLDQLVDLGLAKKTEIKKKFVYNVENPTALAELAKNNRKKALDKELAVQNAMPTLLNFFYTFSERPGVRFFQGIDGIKEIYNDTLRTCQDIYLVRSLYDQDVMTMDYYNKYRDKRAKLGIKTYILNPSQDKKAWNNEIDEKYNLIRTQLPRDSYSTSVEISAYGNKVAIISFGEELIGMIIDSPQISESIKQLHSLSVIAAKSLAD